MLRICSMCLLGLNIMPSLSFLRLILGLLLLDYICTMFVQCRALPLSLKVEGSRVFRTVVKYGCWELKPGPLEEQA